MHTDDSMKPLKYTSVNLHLGILKCCRGPFDLSFFFSVQLGMQQLNWRGISLGHDTSTLRIAFRPAKLSMHAPRLHIRHRPLLVLSPMNWLVDPSSNGCTSITRWMHNKPQNQIIVIEMWMHKVLHFCQIGRAHV